MSCHENPEKFGEGVDVVFQKRLFSSLRTQHAACALFVGGRNAYFVPCFP